MHLNRMLSSKILFHSRRGKEEKSTCNNYFANMKTSANFAPLKK